MTETELKDYVLKNFEYKDGDIIRHDRKNSGGYLDKYGYMTIKIKGKSYKKHRIIWLLNYGELPRNELDHINRIKTDNRIENLRESNRTQQNRNKDIEPNLKTGVRGVYIDEYTKGLKKKYTTRLLGKTYRFYTLEEAIKFRKKEGF